jgi:hypothetical protein
MATAAQAAARLRTTLIPNQVTFRGVAHAEAVEADIRNRVARLEQFYPAIMGCRVLVELPHRHRQDGHHFQVRIEITVPGGAPIVVSHEPSLHGRLAAGEHHKDAEIDGVHRYASKR